LRRIRLICGEFPKWLCRDSSDSSVGYEMWGRAGQA
jgi:hypothetical protein